MKAKAVFLDAYTLDPGDNPLDELDSVIDLECYDHTAYGQILDRVGEAQILIVNKVKIPSEIIDQLKGIRLIQVAATGYNNIDVAEARKHGIDVCNVSGYSTASVVQQVFAMILSYLNRTELYNQQVREGRWSESKHFSYWNSPIRELSGKTMGIIGFGTIGKAVAKVAQSFGMHVLVHTRTPDGREGIEYKGLEETVSRSDFLSLHAPMTEETRHMMDYNRISEMKTGAVLINTARGGLIDEAGLARALKEKRIAAALLDVLSAEPPSADHPLTKLDNCYVTPHQAWASLESRQRLVSMMKDTLKAFLKGNPVNLVN